MSTNIYQVLNIKEHGLETFEAPSTANQNPDSPIGNMWPGDSWLIESCGEDGLNVYYNLYIVYPKDSVFQVTLPWLAQETCGNCQGQGVIYRWSFDNSTYEPSTCPECNGEGSSCYDSEISLIVNDKLKGQRVVRKRQAGRFNARLGLRGDLIINITWVDELPAAASLPLNSTIPAFDSLSGMDS